MKKITALVLAVLSAVGIFAGCSVVIKTPHPLYNGGSEVFIRSNSEKIVQSADLEYDGRDKVEIYLAKNESEGGQFIFKAVNSAVTGLSVSLSDIKSVADGTSFPADNITLYRQRYHNVDKVFDDGLEAGWYPDALLNLKTADNSVSVEKGNNQGYWITVKAKSDTAAGLYKGNATVTFDGGCITVPIEITVWDFDIGTTPHLATAFGASSTLSSGKKWEFYRTLREDYRIVLNSAVDSNTSNQAFWDYLAIDEVSQCGVYMTALNDNTEAVLDKATELGVIDKLYTNLGADEPTPDNYEALCKRAKMFKEAYPDLAIVIPLTSAIPSNEISNYVDWCIKPDVVDKSTVERQHAKNLEVWLYTCNFPTYPTPSYHINDYLVSPRILGAMSNDMDTDGILYWTLHMPWKYVRNDGESGYHYEHSRDTFNDVYICDEWTAGDGCVIYFGSEDDGEVNDEVMVPSLRLEAIRDGMEDYEYFYLLRQKYAAIAEDLGVTVDTDNLVQLYFDNLYSGTTDYYSDPERIQQTRKQMAAAIMGDENFIVSIVKASDDGITQTRKVTVYTSENSVTVNGVNAVKKSNNTFVLNVNIPESTVTDITVCAGDESRTFTVMPRKLTEDTYIINNRELNFSATTKKIKITPAEFDVKKYSFAQYDYMRIVLTNNSDTATDALSLRAVFSTVDDVYSFGTLAAGQTKTFVIPLDSSKKNSPVKAFQFISASGNAASVSIKSVELLATEK